MRIRTIENFRALVLLTLILRIGTWLLSFAAGDLVPGGGEAAGEWSGYGALTDDMALSLLWYAWLTIDVLGFVGLFFFLSPARWFILLALCAAPVLAAISGIAVVSPIEAVASALYQIAYVFTIGMAFFAQPVAVRFARDAQAFAGVGRSGRL